MELMFCAMLPLKFTVLGVEEVTSKLPALMVNALATPSTEADDNFSAVPLIRELNKEAVPVKVDEPVKVAMPAEAENVPLIFKAVEILKSALVVTVPVI